MNIVEDYPENINEVALSKVTIEYEQSLDSCQSENDYPDCCQKLICETDNAGGGKFVRFFTGKAGWSLDFDGLGEIVELLEDFKKRVTP